MMTSNDSSPGERSLDMSDEMNEITPQERYAGVVAADVTEFLSQLAERELIRDA